MFLDPCHFVKQLNNHRMICADPRSVPAWKGKIKPLGNTRSIIAWKHKNMPSSFHVHRSMTACSSIISCFSYAHALGVAPVSCHLFQGHEHSLRLLWLYGSVLHCFAASAAIVSSPARFLPPDLTIRIWPINLSQFHSNLIRTLSRFLTWRRHNIAKAVGCKMTSCCISGGRCMSVFTSERPAQAKAAESRWEAWSKALTNAMFMNCISNNAITVPQSSPWRLPWFLLSKKTTGKTPSSRSFLWRSFTANGQAGLKRRHPTEAAMAPQNCQGSVRG